MLQFRDFGARVLREGGFFSVDEYEPIEQVTEKVNQWIQEEGVRVVNVETVVLPNINSNAEEGTTDMSLRTSGERSSTWHQFVRVWYRR